MTREGTWAKLDRLDGELDGLADSLAFALAAARRELSARSEQDPYSVRDSSGRFVLLDALAATGQVLAAQTNVALARLHVPPGD